MAVSTVKLNGTTLMTVNDSTATAAGVSDEQYFYTANGVRTQGALDLDSYAPLASPAFTGTPTAPTASAGTNTTQIATTAFVTTAVSNAVASEIVKVSIASFSSLPQTVSNAAILATHEVLRAELGTPASQQDTWTITVSAGSLTITGTIDGSTTMTILLGEPGTSI